MQTQATETASFEDTGNQLDSDLGATETDFRRDTVSRQTGEQLSEGGGELGRQTADSIEGALGEDDNEVFELVGQNVGRAPGDAVLFATDVSQAGQEIIRESAGEDDAAPLETGENILRSAGESAIEGVDRNFNVQEDGAAFGLPRIEAREEAEERLAAGAIVGAVSLAAGGPLSSATRAAASRTASASRRAATDVGPDGSRIDAIPGSGRADPRSDRTGSISDGGQISGRETEVTIERGDEAEAESDTNIDDMIGGPDESRSELQQEGIIRAIEQEAAAGRLTRGSRQDSADLEPQTQTGERVLPESSRQRDIDLRQVDADRRQQESESISESLDQPETDLRDVEPDTRQRGSEQTELNQGGLDLRSVDSIERRTRNTESESVLGDTRSRTDQTARTRQRSDSDTERSVQNSLAMSGIAQLGAAQTSAQSLGQTTAETDLFAGTGTDTATDIATELPPIDTTTSGTTTPETPTTDLTTDRSSTTTTSTDTSPNNPRTSSRSETRTSRDRSRPRDIDLPDFGDDPDEREDLFGARLNEGLEEVLTIDDDPLDGFLSEADR
jgi:hypothetical protein